MKTVLKTTAALLLATTTIATAGGLDRSKQGTSIIFADGNYMEISFGYVMPSIDVDGPTPAQGTSDVAKAYSLGSIAFKQQYSDALSMSLIIDQPFGASIDYVGGAFDGINADIHSLAITEIIKYQLNDSISVYAGLKAQSVGGTLDVGVPPQVIFADQWALGYVAGAAYEIPEIALRAALTYHSEITHSLPSTGGLGVGSTEVKTPQAINFDFQTGIMADTLLMASVRWADWDVFRVTPPGFPSSVTNTQDSLDYSIGIGRKFSDAFSGAVTVGYAAASGDTVSALSPADGNWSVTVGGSYKTGAYKISGGISYVVPGDATLTAGGGAFSSSNNSVIGVGFKVGRSF